jgi:lipopolysaccharide/colanic/teichoic acid biosynthesis glycosyltransferase
MGKQGSFIKRLTDILISILILLLSLPILLLAMIAIKIDSKGPIFFIHERTGLGGKPFKMIKFRGMIDNALSFGPVLTQENDPRITRVGKILRRTSIDEIPQFINVLIGNMSIIGPRPEMISITETYDSSQRKVFDFKPGITGISQVSGRQRLTPEERTKIEIEYYSRENFISDFVILLKTIKVVITNEGNI